ncbi:DUF1501 domain-containing protein, partial [bacterium]|nr:DUF1501 domain-containing protein [bacterium]
KRWSTPAVYTSDPAGQQDAPGQPCARVHDKRPGVGEHVALDLCAAAPDIQVIPRRIPCVSGFPIMVRRGQARRATLERIQRIHDGIRQTRGHRRPGPYGGFLGRQYDPVFSFCDPTFASEPKIKHYDPVLAMGDPFMPGLGSAVDMPAHRFENRKSLLTRLDLAYRKQVESASHINLDRHQQRAFELLTSSKTREAFDLSKEPEALRERYGRNLFGSSMLVARRLVEAGVPFISVHQEIFKHYGHSYDMHENNFGMLKNFNLPMLDKLLPALLQDLEERGLLDSTLVIVMGEMGRSPRINGKAGREHWPQCGFSLLAGGGTKQGTVFGTTDKEAGYPVDHPVRPCDLIATIYHLLGIDPHTLIHDRSGRPFPIARGGDPVQGVIA